MKLILRWYHSEYSGSLLMALTVFNLLTSPPIDYAVEIDDRPVLRNLIIIQTVVMMIHLVDLIIMVIIFGLKEVALNKSVGIRLEFVAQVMYWGYLFNGYHDVYNTSYN